jgi:hypothetical protein
MRYVVARVITSPAGSVRTARLLITDVPDKTRTEAVLEALEAAGRSAEFSEGGVPFGNHEVRADGHRGWPYGISGITEAPAITWENLTRPRTRGEGRRVTLRLTDGEYARYSLAAQRAGESLQEWFVTAAEARAAEVATQGRPADQARAAS